MTIGLLLLYTLYSLLNYFTLKDIHYYLSTKISSISTSPLTTLTPSRGFRFSKAISRDNPITKEDIFGLPTSKTSYYLDVKGYLTKELLPYSNSTNTKSREIVIKYTIYNKLNIRI